MKSNLYSLLFFTTVLGATTAQSAVLVDTFTDFSNTSQGVNGIEYGYYTYPNSIIGTFSTEGMVSSLEGWDGSDSFNTPEINPNNQHPGATNLFSAVRRYTVGSAGEPSYTGLVQIAGIFGGQIDLGGGDIIGFININGITSFSAPANGSTAVSFDFTAAVAPGSTIDFGVSPSGNSAGDRTLYTATVSTVPEPSTILFGALGVLGLAVRRIRNDSNN